MRGVGQGYSGGGGVFGGDGEGDFFRKNFKDTGYMNTGRYGNNQPEWFSQMESFGDDGGYNVKSDNNDDTTNSLILMGSGGYGGNGGGGNKT